MENKKMNDESFKEEQVPVEGIVIAHELLEQGTKLVIITPEMENVPRKIKLIW